MTNITAIHLVQTKDHPYFNLICCRLLFGFKHFGNLRNIFYVYHYSVLLLFCCMFALHHFAVQSMLTCPFLFLHWKNHQKGKVYHQIKFQGSWFNIHFCKSILQPPSLDQAISAVKKSLQSSSLQSWFLKHIKCTEYILNRFCHKTVCACLDVCKSTFRKFVGRKTEDYCASLVQNLAKCNNTQVPHQYCWTHKQVREKKGILCKFNTILELDMWHRGNKPASAQARCVK